MTRSVSCQKERLRADKVNYSVDNYHCDIELTMYASLLKFERYCVNRVDCTVEST